MGYVNLHWGDYAMGLSTFVPRVHALVLHAKPRMGLGAPVPWHPIVKETTNVLISNAAMIIFKAARQTTNASNLWLLVIKVLAASATKKAPIFRIARWVVTASATSAALVFSLVGTQPNAHSWALLEPVLVLFKNNDCMIHMKDSSRLILTPLI